LKKEILIDVDGYILLKKAGCEEVWIYLNQDNEQVKQCHNTPMEAQGGEMMYSSYSFTTSALDVGG
jgi:hypothetical protein